MPSKKSLVTASVVVFIVMSFVAVFLLSERYSKGHGNIFLPPSNNTPDIGIGTLPPSNLNDPSHYQELNVTVDGLLDMISGLSRPAHFSAEISCLLGNDNTIKQYSATAEYVDSGNLCRIGLADRYYVLREGRVYTVSADGDKYSESAVDFDLWMICGIQNPTLPPETQPSKISRYGFEELNGTSTVYVEFSRDGYACKQFYSLDNGLLVMTEIFEGNVLIYKSAMQSVSYEKPGDERFSVAE
ncbi:MAG: hypothetical protein IKM04_08515 [Clostridia bacterium]|nr:hypothetical protein [Clostridia bacterium]